MNRLLAFFLFCTFCFFAPAQEDTLNRYNERGLEHGYWIHYASEQYGKFGYAPSDKIEEGFYRNGLKQGNWITYFPNGMVKAVYGFRDYQPLFHVKDTATASAADRISTDPGPCSTLPDITRYDAAGMMESSVRYDEYCKEFAWTYRLDSLHYQLALLQLDSMYTGPFSVIRWPREFAHVAIQSRITGYYFSENESGIVCGWFEKGYLRNGTLFSEGGRTRHVFRNGFYCYTLEIRYEDEEVNQTDESSRKQGWWIIRQTNPKGESVPKEEGNYTDNLKNGYWTSYYEDGKTPGKIAYFSQNKVESSYSFRADGSPVVTPEQQLEKDRQEIPEPFSLTGSGDLPPVVPEALRREKDWQPNGHNAIRYPTHHLWVDADFKDNKITTGMVFTYDSSGELTGVEKYQDGKRVR